MRTTVSINIQIRPDQLWVGPKPIIARVQPDILMGWVDLVCFFLGFLTLGWRFLAWIRPWVENHGSNL